MPQTIAYRTSREEGDYQAATDAEVADLVSAFEAATSAVQAFEAANPAPEWVRRGAEGYEAYEALIEARDETLKPLETEVRRANEALSASRNLPLGTVVRFSSSEGWYGTDSSEGVIVKVTPTSYVAEKDHAYGSSGTARISRENAHGYRSSYSSSNGARSLRVVRTPSQQQVYRQQQAEARRQQALEREALTAQREAERAVQDARNAQQETLREAQRKALAVILRRHGQEYEILVKDALDLLSEDAPGREQTAPLKTT